VPPPEVVALYADPERCIPGWPGFRAELERLHGPGTALPLVRGWADAMAALRERGGAINDAEAAAVSRPALVIAGDRDPFNPLAETRALVARMPAARLFVLAGVGHDLLSERGPQLIALVRRMLQDGGQLAPSPGGWEEESR
jgi:pimeloyl-ACP methyl ester carboxylesterase